MSDLADWTRDAAEIGAELGCHFPQSTLTTLADLLDHASQACDYAADDLAERAHYERNHCGSEEQRFTDVADAYSQTAERLSLLAAEVRFGEEQGREDHPA